MAVEKYTLGSMKASAGVDRLLKDFDNNDNLP